MTEGPPWKCKRCGEMSVYSAGTVSQPCQECGGSIEGKGWECRSCNRPLAHPDLRQAHLESKEHSGSIEAARKKEDDRRRTEIDARILAGLSPDAICRAVPGSTEAQVTARRVELARLEVHRGKPWAEAALDAEILRLSRTGVPREEISKQLAVGAHRIARVRREAGLGRRRSWRETINSGAGASSGAAPVSRRLPDPVPDDDLPRRRDDLGTG